MIKNFKFVLLIFFSQACYGFNDFLDDELDSAYSGNLVSFIDAGIGLSTHQVDESERGALGGLLKVSAGVQWYSFISAQVGLWYWGANNSDADRNRKQDSQLNSEQDRELDTERTRFESISASVEITLQLPLSNQNTTFQYGPYYRVGQHCWSAVLTGLTNPWQEEGCSAIHSVGFLFPLTNYNKEFNAFYLEATQSNFDAVSTKSIQLGAKVPF